MSLKKKKNVENDSVDDEIRVVRGVDGREEIVLASIKELKRDSAYFVRVSPDFFKLHSAKQRTFGRAIESYLVHHGIEHIWDEKLLFIFEERE